MDFVLDRPYLIGDAGVRQQHSALPPPHALVPADRPQDVPPLRLLPLLDVERPRVFTEHVVPEGHAQVGVRRREGQAGQPGHLPLLVIITVIIAAVARFARHVCVTQVHVDEVAQSACRGQQRTR